MKREPHVAGIVVQHIKKVLKNLPQALNPESQLKSLNPSEPQPCEVAGLPLKPLLPERSELSAPGPP